MSELFPMCPYGQRDHCFQSADLAYPIPGNVKKIGKIFTGPTYKLVLSFTLIYDVYKSFIPNKHDKITLTKHCLDQCISKLPGAFQSIE